MYPNLIDSDALRKRFTDSQKALSNLPSIALYMQYTSTAKLELSLVKGLPEDVAEYWKLYNRFPGLPQDIYRFRIGIKFESYYDELLENEGLDSNEVCKNDILPHEAEKRFYEFLMVLNICQVGGFDYGPAMMEMYWGYKNLRTMNTNTKDIFEYSFNKKWPQFSNLEIESTWNWFIIEIKQNGSDDISYSSLGRALNAFSYLYEDSSEINKLFWTLVGLEAIYVKGKEGISQQIKQKGQLFLGEIEEFKKRLTKMYAFRSAFVHGSKDFPSYFNMNGETDPIENFEIELDEILLTAESMLIATIQKMAHENRKNLEFSYSII